MRSLTLSGASDSCMVRHEGLLLVRGEERGRYNCRVAARQIT